MLHGNHVIGLALVGLPFIAGLTRVPCMAITLPGMVLIGAFDGVFNVPRVSTPCYLTSFLVLPERRQEAGL